MTTNAIERVNDMATFLAKDGGEGGAVISASVCTEHAADLTTLLQALEKAEGENERLRTGLIAARKTLEIEADTFFVCNECGHQHDDLIRECDVYFLLSNDLDELIGAPLPAGDEPSRLGDSA